MRRVAAVAVLVTGVLVGAGPGPAEAGPGKYTPGPRRSFNDTLSLLGMTFRSGIGLELNRLQARVSTVFDPRESEIGDVVREGFRAVTIDLWIDTSQTWNDKVEEVRGTDPEVAAQQSAAGQLPRTAADKLHEAERIATGKFRIGIGKTLAEVREAFEEAGQPVAIVGPIIPDPPHPLAYLHPSVPNIFPMGMIVGSCDGTATVLTLDPAVGQEPAADESYIQFVGPDSPDVAAELRMKSGVDFPADEPSRSSAFEFTGLAPGTYIVDVGVIKDGVRARVAYEAITIPDWGGTQIAPDPTIAAQVKESGVSLRRFVKQAGSTLVREARAIAKDAARGTAPTDELFGRASDLFGEVHRQFRTLREAHRDDWIAAHGALRMTNPFAAANEITAGRGSAAERVQADEGAADDLGRKYLLQAAVTMGNGFAKRGSPIAYSSSSAGRTPHPASYTPATSSNSRSFFNGISVLATCSGNLSMFVVDPRDDDEIDRVFFEIREIDTRTLVLRRELVDVDFEEESVALVEAAGLLQPGRTYDVRLVSGGDPPFATLDAAVITCPNWSGAEPPPPPPSCGATTASVTHDGQALAIPPLFSFTAAFVGNGLQSVNVVFKDPAKPNDPTVNFSMLVSVPIPLDGSLGEEWIFTYPPRVAGLGAYVYDPVTFYFTSASTATVTIRNLKNLLSPPGCVEIVIDGTTPDGKPVRFRFTLHTDQMNK